MISYLELRKVMIEVRDCLVQEVGALHRLQAEVILDAFIRRVLERVGQ